MNVLTSIKLNGNAGTTNQALISAGAGAVPTWGSIVVGSGTINYLTKWTSAAGLGNSLIYDNGTNVGINTITPTKKLTIEGNHTTSQFLLHSTGGDTAATEADLCLWASEPAISYSGVGISNNIENYNGTAAFQRINTARGGSYIRLLDNAISLNIVSSAGVNVNAMYVDSNGNIGIGTTSPGTKLQVNGSILIPNNNYFHWGAGDGTTYIYGDATNPTGSLRLGTGNIDRLTVLYNGNVGIGTAAPGDSLQVQFSDAGYKGITIKGTGGSSFPQLTLDRPYNYRGSWIKHSTAGTGDWFAGTLYADGGPNTAYSISTDYNAGNAKLTILTDGKVGIGHSNPSTKFHVSGTDGVNILFNGATKGVRILHSSTQTRIEGVDNTGFGSFQPFVFNSSQTSFEIDAAVIMTITNSGFVGIGTTTPYGKLVVNNGTNRNLYITSDAAQAGTTGMAIVSLNDAASLYMPLSILGSSIYINNSTTVNGFVQAGDVAATNGSILLRGNYYNNNAQTVFTEFSSGGIGLGQYMYQSGSASWLSAFPYGAISRGALIVTQDSLRFISAPAQDIAVGVSLTTQPTIKFIIDANGNMAVGASTPVELFTLGTAGTKAGVISFAGATSGKAILQTSAAAGTPTLTLPTVTGTLATLANVETFTNKRINGRVLTITSSATPTINTDSYDFVVISNLEVNITSMTTNLTGSPLFGNTISFRITDNEIPRTITWGGSFTDGACTLPTTTVGASPLWVTFFWGGEGVWECMAKSY